MIVASVISKNSLPQLHSAAALMKLCTMPYSGAVSIFLRALVNKKYTLPYVAVDALAAHFVRFRDSHEPAMPVIWHQALLAVAQRYKADLTREQKAALHALAGKYAHHVLSAEIRRELGSAGCRGEAVSMPVGAAAGGAGGAKRRLSKRVRDRTGLTGLCRIDRGERQNGNPGGRTPKESGQFVCIIFFYFRLSRSHIQVDIQYI